MSWLREAVYVLGAAALLLAPMRAAAQDPPPGTSAGQPPGLVEPSDRVVRGVVVRQEPTTASAALAELPPDGAAELVSERPGWFEVRLSDGTSGWVSRRWTVAKRTALPPELLAADRFVVQAIDVGTGLAVLVTGPDFTLLYDGGSNDDDAIGPANRLVAFLRRAHPALRRIDHVVLSHPHTDHVALLADVVRAYEVGEVWDSGRVNGICGYRAFLESIEARGNVVYHSAVDAGPVHVASFRAMTCRGVRLPERDVRLGAGARIGREPLRLGRSASMRFLHADGAAYSDVNRNSLVLQLALGSRRVLLTGDAEAGGRADPSVPPTRRSIEGRLLECCRELLRADVLFPGHHGSETSSRSPFLDAVGAPISVVSSGPTRYSGVKLPDEIVVQELGRRGTLWRTDLDDAACALADKIGPDDRRPGGCDNVRIDIGPAGVAVAYERLRD